MPIKSSPYFNNPQFAQAASNIAQLFEPPSGADAAGWAAANAKKAEAARLADFYDYAKNPAYDQATADRMGVGAGVYQPNQSFYSVDQGNATTRRGQDVSAATSRANNADDNARALSVEKLGGLQKFYGPLDQGQLRPEIPADIAGQFGVDRALPVEQGNAKPLSEEQLKAAILGTMPRSAQEAAAFGNTPVENVVTPNGPRIASRLDAIGQEPAYAPKGAGVTVTTNPDGTVTYSQGGDKPLTGEQGKLVNYGATAKVMNDVLDQHGHALTSAVEGASEMSPTIGTVNPGNFVQTPEYQQARVAGERFVQAILRNESGAATPDAEISHYQSTLLPRPGDSPEVEVMKAWARTVAVNALEGGMGAQARKAAVDAAQQSGPPPGWKPGDAIPGAAPAASAPAAAPAPAPTGAGPQPGAVEGGYRFKGGNPSDPASWEPVQ